MKDWWKSPVLQGPENDYGQYDYLIEELPKNEARWELSKYKWKCDDCGKDHYLLFCITQYFYTLDGYDYFSWNTCWKCMLKNKIANIKWRIKKKMKVIKTTFELCKDFEWDFKKCYSLAVKLER